MFNYDTETGFFTRKTGKKAGCRAGCSDKSKGGYVRLTIPIGGGKYVQIYAHRAAWVYVHGDGLSMDIDHCNGVRYDNRIDNLRPADRSQNQWNYPKPKTNKTGFKGVRLCKKTGRYRAYIKQFNKRIHLGTFDTAEEASAAYSAKAIELFGEFVRTEPANDNRKALAA